MSDQTKPRVWNAGDPEPEGVAMVRDCMGDTWTREPVLGGPDVWMSAETHTMTWERIAKKYAPLAEVQSSSPVHGPSEDGNASEASSQPGGTVLFSEREDRIYRTDPMIVDLWQVYAPVEEIHDHDLPIDTVKIGEPDRVRADAAEAKLAQPCGSCHPCGNWADETWRRAGQKPPHFEVWQEKVAEHKRDRAKLAEVRAVLAEYEPDTLYGHEAVARARAIVNPEAGREKTFLEAFADEWAAAEAPEGEAGQ